MHKILYFVFFFSCVSFAQGSSGKIQYAQKIISLGIDTSSIHNSRIKDVIISQNKQAQKALGNGVVLYTLIFNNTESVFKPIQQMDIGDNSILKKIQEQSIFYIDNSKKIKLEQVEIFGTSYLIKESFVNNNIEWTIYDEKKIIGGYSCHKASTKVEYQPGKFKVVNAWFSPEISVNFGPKGFYGLPGLILGLEDNGKFYYAANIKIDKNKNDIIINPPSKGKKVSQEEYRKIINETIKKMRNF